MKIAVDAMGGDHGPQVIVEGVADAVKEYGIEVILLGDETKINPLLAKVKQGRELISVHPALEVIEMHESPAASVRRKRNSTIVVGIKLVKEGKADAFFSAGNTGAVICAATLDLGLLPGAERPGIAVVIPTLKDPSIIVDVGANIDSKPAHLLQYAQMARAYYQNILNKPNPTVGLLNIGEEETKGTEFLKETYDLLSRNNVNFVGNVEGKALFFGKCDIIVCDGFVGNIALKVTEGTAEAIQVFLKRHLIKSSIFGKLGLFLLKPTFKKFKKDLDYAEYGGAILLGVNGIVVIGHGRSNARAIKNAIRVVKEEVANKVNEKISEALHLPQ